MPEVDFGGRVRCLAFEYARRYNQGPHRNANTCNRKRNYTDRFFMAKNLVFFFLTPSEDGIESTRLKAKTKYVKLMRGNSGERHYFAVSNNTVIILSPSKGRQQCVKVT